MLWFGEIWRWEAAKSNRQSEKRTNIIDGGGERKWKSEKDEEENWRERGTTENGEKKGTANMREKSVGYNSRKKVKERNWEERVENTKENGE